MYAVSKKATPRKLRKIARFFRLNRVRGLKRSSLIETKHTNQNSLTEKSNLTDRAMIRNQMNNCT